MATKKTKQPAKRKTAIINAQAEEIANLRQQITSLKTERKKAIELAVRYGGIEESHHLEWIIDQMVRILAGADYAEIVKSACDGEDGPNTYSWSTGIAP